jgi:hypothetical protein
MLDEKAAANQFDWTAATTGTIAAGEIQWDKALAVKACEGGLG